MSKYIFLFFLVILVACQADEPDATAVPTLPAPTQPVIVPPTATTAPAATAVPTETTAATATAVPTPTETPLPTALPPASPVTSIQLIRLIRRGLVKPVYLTHAGDGRLFVVEQDGRVRVVQNGQLLDTPFLDINERVGSEANEQGLLSVAFHPNYAENGRFFVNYTNNQGHTIIGRFQVSSDPNQADPNSEVILLTINQPYANHNGGQIQFGPDGNLYIGMGDGGDQGDPHSHGQNPNTHLGTILRINVDHEGNGLAYAIPADNPFALGGGAPEVWAIGFRNPWRFSFDRLTGDFYVADVGQNSWEEISFLPAPAAAGQNFGWNRMEGSTCYQFNCNPAGLVLPVAEYSHDEGGCSVTGGYVYHGRQYPILWGNYFFADYCTGFVWSLFHQPDGTWVKNLVTQVNFSVSSFGEDANGELYLLNHRGGEVWQVVP